MIEPIFDKTEEYENHVLDIVNKLRTECSKRGMPMFVSVCVKNTPDKTVYKNEMISAVSSDITLHDDKFVDFTNVINGFITVPQREKFELNEDYMGIDN